ncbi:MAG: hypothetical protein AABN33_05880 [Acidobacteriota bacterium]
MYCPTCSSNNLANIRFCTRCGTNLAVVSEALSGESSAQPPIDERMVKVLKDYYSSRRATLIGGLTLPVGLSLLMAMFLTGFPEHLIIIALIGLGLTIYGAIVGIWGIGHWIDSTSELKALNIAVATHSLPAASRDKVDTSRITSIPALVERYSTDPIDPGSVTDGTTRQLEGPPPKSSPQLQSE